MFCSIRLGLKLNYISILYHIIISNRYLGSNWNQQFGDEVTMPVVASRKYGIGCPLGAFTVKFCIMAVKKRNMEFRANVSPAHKRFPVDWKITKIMRNSIHNDAKKCIPNPKGIDWSFLGQNLPWSSRNRSGWNLFGSTQTFGSLLAADNVVTTKAP